LSGPPDHQRNGDDRMTASLTGEPRRTRPRGIAAVLRGQMRNIAPFLTLICLIGFFSFASPSFATLDNVGNILTQVSVTGIIAVGLTFVILCAEIDLSVAGIANAAGIVVAYFTAQESYVNIANLPLSGAAAIMLAFLACSGLGLVNALGVTIIGIPSFIMTLAMMQIAAGVSALLVRGQIAYKVPDLIATLGSGSIGGIPWIVIVAAVLLLAGHIVLTYTRFGRYVYIVGGNREAAEYSGLNVKLILGTVMVISAVCSGIAGMLGVAHFGSAQQNEFDTYLLDAIAAVVVGGTSLFGGRGGIGNTIVGLFVLGVLNNGLDHVKIDSFLKILIRGLILLVALIINVYAQRLRSAGED
jgi:ribose transport system permease protein